MMEDTEEGLNLPLNFRDVQIFAKGIQTKHRQNLNLTFDAFNPLDHRQWSLLTLVSQRTQSNSVLTQAHEIYLSVEPINLTIRLLKSLRRIPQLHNIEEASAWCFN